jgi:hypothetical protein
LGRYSREKNSVSGKFGQKKASNLRFSSVRLDNSGVGGPGGWLQGSKIEIKKKFEEKKSKKSKNRPPLNSSRSRKKIRPLSRVYSESRISNQSNHQGQFSSRKKNYDEKNPYFSNHKMAQYSGKKNLEGDLSKNLVEKFNNFFDESPRKISKKSGQISNFQNSSESENFKSNVMNSYRMSQKRSQNLNRSNSKNFQNLRKSEKSPLQQRHKFSNFPKKPPLSGSNFISGHTLAQNSKHQENFTKKNNFGNVQKPHEND